MLALPATRPFVWDYLKSSPLPRGDRICYPKYSLFRIGSSRITYCELSPQAKNRPFDQRQPTEEGVY